MEQQTGIAKAAPVTESIPVPVQQPQPAEIPVMFDGIPLELIRYFGVDVRSIDDRYRQQLTDIYHITRGENMSMGDVLLKLHDIESRLGPCSLGETRSGKLWGWLKISKRIEDLRKQQKAWER